MSALYKANTRLGWIFIVLALWNNSPHVYTCCYTRTYYPDPDQPVLGSYALMLRAKRENNKYKFYSIWFNPTRVRIQDLPHSRMSQRINILYMYIKFKIMT